MANNHGEESSMQLANAEPPNPSHSITATTGGEDARPIDFPHPTVSSTLPPTHSPLQLLQSSVVGFPPSGDGQSRPYPTSRAALFTSMPPTNAPAHDMCDSQDSNNSPHTNSTQTTTATALLTTPTASRELSYPNKARYRNRRLEFNETHNFLTIFSNKLDLITSTYPAPPPPVTAKRSRMDHLYESEYVDGYHYHLIFPEDDPYFIPFDSEILTTRFVCNTCEPTKHFWQPKPCSLPGHSSGKFCMPASCYHPDHAGCNKCYDVYVPEPDIIPPFPPGSSYSYLSDSDDSYDYYGPCYELTDSDFSSGYDYAYDCDSD